MFSKTASVPVSAESQWGLGLTHRMAPSGRRVDGLCHLAMGSSEMVRFGLQGQATGMWKEVSVGTQSQTTWNFYMNPNKRKRKAKRFFSAAVKIWLGPVPGLPLLTLASVGRVSFPSGEVIKLQMCLRHGAQVTKRAIPPPSPHPTLPG